MKNKLDQLLIKLKIKRHFINKADRIALFSLFNTFTSAIIAIFKIGLGIFYLSNWFLIFGFYYLILFFTRVYFLRRYTQIRLQNLTAAKRIAKEDLYLREGGLLYSLLGFALAGISGYMYTYGSNQSYSELVIEMIALMGFIKIISSVVGWFKTRKFNSPILLFLKALNIADGLVAIVMTQYVILSYEHSPSASSSTGLFGMGIGSCLVVIGIVILIRSHFFRKDGF
ncbi:hypothetical protein [Lactobacillus sp. Sy-1]|uniref:hypothetical protein n=1 Tax=Lactobacillus sp. Sy-1 TaxID=2109645 RepID=UPI001C5BBDEC|nr:hypothetical protein [Lactobacillus sp. Sy-1]MBW1606376.1 hypothetical protein [Lactobacillus sp. Sy-1]